MLNFGANPRLCDEEAAMQNKNANTRLTALGAGLGLGAGVLILVLVNLIWIFAYMVELHAASIITFW
jgi:hypothetical protein